MKKENTFPLLHSILNVGASSHCSLQRGSGFHPGTQAVNPLNIFLGNEMEMGVGTKFFDDEDEDEDEDVRLDKSDEDYKLDKDDDKRTKDEDVVADDARHEDTKGQNYERCPTEKLNSSGETAGLLNSASKTEASEASRRTLSLQLFSSLKKREKTSEEEKSSVKRSNQAFPNAVTGEIKRVKLIPWRTKARDEDEDALLQKTSSKLNGEAPDDEFSTEPSSSKTASLGVRGFFEKVFPHTVSDRTPKSLRYGRDQYIKDGSSFLSSLPSPSGKMKESDASKYLENGAKKPLWGGRLGSRGGSSSAAAPNLEEEEEEQNRQERLLGGSSMHGVTALGIRLSKYTSESWRVGSEGKTGGVRSGEVKREQTHKEEMGLTEKYGKKPPYEGMEASSPFYSSDLSVSSTLSSPFSTSSAPSSSAFSPSSTIRNAQTYEAESTPMIASTGAYVTLLEGYSDDEEDLPTSHQTKPNVKPEITLKASEGVFSAASCNFAQLMNKSTEDEGDSQGRKAANEEVGEFAATHKPLSVLTSIPPFSDDSKKSDSLHEGTSHTRSFFTLHEEEYEPSESLEEDSEVPGDSVAVAHTVLAGHTDHTEGNELNPLRIGPQLPSVTKPSSGLPAPQFLLKDEHLIQTQGDRKHSYPHSQGRAHTQTAELGWLDSNEDAVRDNQLPLLDAASMNELRHLKKLPPGKIQTIDASDLRDPNWYLSVQSGSHTAASSTKFSLPTKVWSTSEGETIHVVEPKRMQKRKHQINWLAKEAQEKELELLEKSAHARRSKHDAYMKYGW